MTSQKDRNRRVNTRCPACNMDLAKSPQGGFVADHTTFCCEGCARGRGCTCRSGIQPRKNYNRPGSRGQRNADNTVDADREHTWLDSTGATVAEPKSKSPPRQEIRGQRGPQGVRRARSQSEERPSTREQARGRSELRGKLNKRVNRTEHIDRLSRTGSKAK